MILRMPFNIEVATPADADGLAALHHLSHTKSFAAFASPEWVKSRRLETYLTQWRNNLDKDNLNPKDPKSRTWVAHAEDRIVGMVRISPMAEDGLAQLTSMHVDPDHQGQGIGGALMKTAEGFIREAGYRRAILGVIVANRRARALYEKSGWTMIEEHPTGVEGVPTAVYGKRFDATG